MNKKIYILFILILLTTLFVNGQDIVFQDNLNSSARVLKQSLNKNGDSLILKSENIIRQVDVFNKDYMKSIAVNSNEYKVDISTLPVGEFIVQARLGRKRIIMYLVKNETTNLKREEIELNINIESKVVTTDISIAENLDDGTLALKQNATEKSIKESEKKRSGFWVVYETNTSSGSSKYMSFANEDEVSRMIAKNKLELSTEIAKNNTLLVYEVYDTSKFMRNQFKSPKYFKSSKSKFFNVVPYYTSKGGRLKHLVTTIF